MVFERKSKQMAHNKHNKRYIIYLKIISLEKCRLLDNSRKNVANTNSSNLLKIYTHIVFSKIKKEEINYPVIKMSVFRNSRKKSNKLEFGGFARKFAYIMLFGH